MDEVKELFEWFFDLDRGFDVILKVVEDNVGEGFYIDYKELWSFGNLVVDGRFLDDFWKYFVRYVSVFSNIFGGVLVWGV